MSDSVDRERASWNPARETPEALAERDAAIDAHEMQVSIAIYESFIREIEELYADVVRERDTAANPRVAKALEDVAERLAYAHDTHFS